MGIMLIFRKFLVFVLSVILYVVIVGTATAGTINLVFAHPTKIETELQQSKLYDHFIDNALQQANKSSNTGSNGGGISTSDPAVTQAINQAFSPAVLQQDVNTVIDANYAWLDGKTAKPVFVVDLSGPKKEFATLVGQSVTAHLASLPVCTSAQLATLNYENADPLTITCRPVSVVPAAEGAKVTAKLLSSDGFLKQTSFTADTISQNGGKAYYVKASFAPKVYHYATVAPYALLGAIVVLSLMILFLAPRRRNGVRSLSIVYLLSGIVLIGAKFGSDVGFKYAQNKAFNNTDVGPLQQSLTTFLHSLQTSVGNDYMYIGIGLVILSVLGFTSLIVTRKRSAKSYKSASKTKAHQPVAPQQQPAVAENPVETAQQQPVGTAPTVPAASSSGQKPKKPRLIQ